jgi:AraC-like DNA-binding protein
MTLRLVRLLEQRGVAATEICELAGLSLEEVTNASARVPYQDADALLERCVERLGEPGFATALSRVVDVDTYDAAGLLLLSSATFGDGLARAFTYQRLWADGERFTFLRDLTSGTVRFEHPGPSPMARAVFAELAFLETMAAARRLATPEARAIAVRFAHRQRATDDELTSELGVRPTYGASRNELVLDEALLAAPIRLPKGALTAMHTALADRALRDLPQDLSIASRLRAILNGDPTALRASLGDVAARLRLAPRSVQRALMREGTTFKDLIDAARRERVRQLDARHVQAKEVAFLVGFADPSALARARRRWSGLSRSARAGASTYEQSS